MLNLPNWRPLTKSSLPIAFTFNLYKSPDIHCEVQWVAYRSIVLFISFYINKFKRWKWLCHVLFTQYRVLSISKKSFSLFFAALEICCTKRSLRNIWVFYIFVSIFWTSNIFLYSQRVSLYSSETNLIKENHECEKVLWKDKSFALPYFL